MTDTPEPAKARTMLLHPGDRPAIHLDEATRHDPDTKEGFVEEGDAPQLREVTSNTVAFIESEMRRLNPGVASDVPVCAGCALNVILSSVGELLTRSGASIGEAMEVFGTMRDTAEMNTKAVIGDEFINAVTRALLGADVTRIDITDLADAAGR